MSICFPTGTSTKPGTIVFFFSSRRRHTRLQGDWSSDVCSSDLQWRALAATWRAVVGGSGRVTLLEGEAGVGKTRLAEEFLRWVRAEGGTVLRGRGYEDRKSTRLNSSHLVISYALFFLEKKKNRIHTHI